MGHGETVMKKIVLRASALTMSGYGVHARQIAKWLLEAEKAGKCTVTAQLLSWGDTPWVIDSSRFDGLIGELMKRSQPCENPDISVQLQLPNEWDPKLAEFNIGVTAAVETDKCNPSWIENCNMMDLIIVPSEHAKLSLERSGTLTCPIMVIPESFPDCFSDLEPAADIGLKFDTSFNFLVFGQITGNNPENDRKNIFYTIKWFCETFKDKKDVGLIIKTNHGRNTRIDRNICTQMLNTVLKEVRKGAAGPPVYLVHGDMLDHEVHALLTHPSVKAMINLTRGEGFGLPMLEAAAVGLPVIATNWSAHTEFLNLGKWIQIDYNLAPVHESRIDDRIFMKGTRWAAPVEANFKQRVRKFYESSSIPKEWALELRETILKTHSHKSIAAKYDEALEQVFTTLEATRKASL
jgi:hypothetical protein